MKYRPMEDLAAWAEAWDWAARRASKRWRPVASWAFKYSGKTMPRRRGLVLRFVGLAIRLEANRVLVRYWLRMSCPTKPGAGVEPQES